MVQVDHEHSATFVNISTKSATFVNIGTKSATFVIKRATEAKRLCVSR